MTIIVSMSATHLIIILSLLLNGLVATLTLKITGLLTKTAMAIIKFTALEISQIKLQLLALLKDFFKTNNRSVDKESPTKIHLSAALLRCLGHHLQYFRGAQYGAL